VYSLFTLFKNILYVFSIGYLMKARNKKYDSKCKIKDDSDNNDSLIPKQFFYIVCASVIESISYFKINQIVNISDNPINCLNTFLLFIPVSFIVEIIFDFFHYWTHRIAHEVPFIYKYVHKTHHANIKLTPIVALYQDPIDYVLTNCIPFTLSLLIVQNLFRYKFNLLMYSLLIAYKDFVEIAGHASIPNPKLYGFPQFIWLPIYFNIHIVQPDHDNHHKYGLCNYSKRFTLWDKVFGTYKYHNLN